GDLAGIIRRNLSEDPHRDARTTARNHYFGFERGESSTRFLDFVDECVQHRDELVTARASGTR
ncbi:hypothetical protein, partial [Isoptericola halotolerans]